MFDKEKVYKFELFKEGKTIYYTAEVLEEDEHLIKINTKFQEELILGKRHIVQCKIVDELQQEYDSVC